MNTARIGILVGMMTSFMLVACDDKPKTNATPSATVSAAVASAPIPAGEWTGSPPVASASANAFGAAGSSLITGDKKDVILTVKDPAKEPEKTIKAEAGGSVTLFLPDSPGTVWSIDTADKTLGKAKEEVIPGFAPGTNGHQFKWPTNGPLIKSGSKFKVQLVKKKAADKAAKPEGNFTLTIEIT